MSTTYPWIKDSQYVSPPQTDYLAITSPNGLYTASTFNIKAGGGNITLNTTGTGIITANCAIQPTAIRDSASGNGTSGQVLTAGTGGQLLWGANGVSSITAGSNIGITGTSTVQVSVLNPLTSVLNIGTQSITGTSGTISMTNNVVGTGSKASITGLQVEVADNTTATTTVQLSKQSLSCQDISTACSYTKSAITKTTGNLTIQAISGNINSVASGQVNIQSGTGISLIGGGGQGILTNQPAGTSRSVLRTGLGTNYSDYLDYHPAVVLDNNNASNISIQNPVMAYQGLTIINKGISPPTNVWGDTNIVANVNGYDCMYKDPQTGYWWVSSGENIYVMDTLFNSVQQGNLAVVGSSSGGPTKVNCFYWAGGFMYIGGDFSGVQDAYGLNFTPQDGLSRINTSNYGVGSYIFDPIYDPRDRNGVFGYVNTMYSINGILYVGGNFLSFANSGAAAFNLFRVSRPYDPSGTQEYDTNSDIISTDAEVFCLCLGGSDNLFVGGSYTQVQCLYSGQNYPYFSVYLTSSSSWTYCAGNSFNGPVYSCSMSSVNPGYIFAGGAFNSPNVYTCYIDGYAPNTTATPSGVSTTTIGGINRIYSGYGRDYIIDDVGNVYYSTVFANFTGLNNAGINIPTGVAYDGVNNGYACGLGYGYVRANNVSQTATFTLPSAQFRYNSGTYQSATLGLYSAQTFVADSTGQFYYPVGPPACSFS
jgi:hypothetical protein